MSLSYNISPWKDDYASSAKNRKIKLEQHVMHLLLKLHFAGVGNTPSIKDNIIHIIEVGGMP